MTAVGHQRQFWRLTLMSVIRCKRRPKSDIFSQTASNKSVQQPRRGTASQQMLCIRSLLRQFGFTTMTQHWEIQSAYDRFSVCRILFIREQGPRTKRRHRCKSASNIPKPIPMLTKP